jgi:hypothetical protein
MFEWECGDSVLDNKVLKEAVFTPSEDIQIVIPVILGLGSNSCQLGIQHKASLDYLDSSWTFSIV